MGKRRLNESWMKLTEGISLPSLLAPIITLAERFVIRLAATPAFPQLRRFKQGRWFKQWTGDDSKALMKVRIMMDLDCEE
jgi:hypothetical protein